MAKFEEGEVWIGPTTGKEYEVVEGGDTGVLVCERGVRRRWTYESWVALGYKLRGATHE